MVQIKNIKRTDKYIYADCYKEGEEYFELILDAETLEIIQPSGYINMYARQAAIKVREIVISEDQIPDSIYAAWC